MNDETLQSAASELERVRSDLIHGAAQIASSSTRSMSANAISAALTSALDTALTTTTTPTNVDCSAERQMPLASVASFSGAAVAIVKLMWHVRHSLAVASLEIENYLRFVRIFG